jgi:ribose transport system permease protein
MREIGATRKDSSGWKVVQQLRMVFVLLAMILVFSLLSPYFIKIKNIYSIGMTCSVIGIVCIGQALVLLTGMFDLSVGAIAGFVGMAVAYLTNAFGMYPIMLAAGILIGMLLGLVNGLLVAKGKVNALITTLGMMTILQGSTFLISNGYAIGVGLPEFKFLGTTRIFSIPLPILILIALYMVFYVILKFTVFGRYIYCIGGNRESARLSGIDIDAIQILVFVLAGALAAFGGVILASRLSSAQTSAGGDYAMNSIAACVLGGISLVGGEGNIWSALVGVVIIGVLQSGLIMINMPSYYQWIATGLVLILAVYFDARKK